MWPSRIIVEELVRPVRVGWATSSSANGAGQVPTAMSMSRPKGQRTSGSCGGGISLVAE